MIFIEFNVYLIFSTPRYCSVQLLPGSDIEKVKEELCAIKFGDGFLTAEKRHNIDEKIVVSFVVE